MGARACSGAARSLEIAGRAWLAQVLPERSIGATQSRRLCSTLNQKLLCEVYLLGTAKFLPLHSVANDVHGYAREVEYPKQMLPDDRYQATDLEETFPIHCSPPKSQR